MNRSNNLIISLLLLGVVFLIFSVNIGGQPNPFEGVVKYKITSEGDVTIIKYYSKQNNFRMEVIDEKVSTILFIDDKMYFLMEDQNMYMEFPANQPMGMNPNMVKERDPNMVKDQDEKVDVESIRTGETKTILDRECEKWFYEDEDGESFEMWLADNMGNFMFMQNPMSGGSEAPWSNKVEGSGHFPLLVIHRDSDGEEQSRFAVEEVNEMDLNDNLFKIPSHLNKMNIPGMGNYGQ